VDPLDQVGQADHLCRVDPVVQEVPDFQAFRHCLCLQVVLAHPVDLAFHSDPLVLVLPFRQLGQAVLERLSGQAFHQDQVVPEVRSVPADQLYRLDPVCQAVHFDQEFQVDLQGREDPLDPSDQVDTLCTIHLQRLAPAQQCPAFQADQEFRRDPSRHQFQGHPAVPVDPAGKYSDCRTGIANSPVELFAAWAE